MSNNLLQMAQTILMQADYSGIIFSTFGSGCLPNAQ
jgi:hypothetical protein